MEQTGVTKEKEYYCVADIQRLLGIGRSSAYNLVASDGFPHITVGNRIIIPVNHFNDWVDKQIIRGGGDNV